MNRRRAMQAAAASVFLPLVTAGQETEPAPKPRIVEVPPGYALFTHYHDKAVADNGVLIFAGLAKGEDGVIVWRDGVVLLQWPGDATYGDPELDWDEPSGALLVSAANNAGTEIRIEAVPGVSKATG